jgi:hypothetical protein
LASITRDTKDYRCNPFHAATKRAGGRGAPAVADALVRSSLLQAEPPADVVSLYMDQFPAGDLSREVSSLEQYLANDGPGG